jgi:hypothetical protein
MNFIHAHGENCMFGKSRVLDFFIFGNQRIHIDDIRCFGRTGIQGCIFENSGILVMKAAGWSRRQAKT